MKEQTSSPTTQSPKSKGSPAALVDLAIFLSVMFLVREIRIDSLGFWGYSLFKSLVTVGVATLLLYYRGQSWKNLGLRNPNNYLRSLGIVAITLVGTVVSIMIFEVLLRDAIFGVETGTESNSLLDDMEWTVSYFLSIILFVWMESLLEELQDRGFSLNRFELLFSKVPLSTIIAVLCQAAVFGFRHSYDFSPRSVTTGLIGLVFGTVYVLTGRNLWPLILAHIVLNTLSIIERL